VQPVSLDGAAAFVTTFDIVSECYDCKACKPERHISQLHKFMPHRT